MAFMVKESSHIEKSLANVQGKDIRLYNMQPRVLTDNVEWDSLDLVSVVAVRLTTVVCSERIGRLF